MAQEGWAGISDAGESVAARTDAERFAGAVEAGRKANSGRCALRTPRRPTAVRKSPTDAAFMSRMNAGPSGL
jgi:hypothetical protein